MSVLHIHIVGTLDRTLLSALRNSPSQLALPLASSCGSEVQSSPHCNGRSWLLLWKNTFAFLCGVGCALNCTPTLVRQCKSALVWFCSRVYSNVHWVEPALGSPSSIFTRQEWRITRACPTLVSPGFTSPTDSKVTS